MGYRGQGGRPELIRRKLSSPQRAAGITLVEVLVVVILIGILAGFALQRLLPLIGKAEAVAFATVVNQLDNALLLETAKRIAGGKGASVPQLIGSNPMDLMLRPPGNYLGEISVGADGRIAKRSWYFNPIDETLVYRIGSGAHFISGERRLERVEFRVSMVFRDRDGDQVYSPQADDFGGISLRPKQPYRVVN